MPETGNKRVPGRRVKAALIDRSGIYSSAVQKQTIPIIPKRGGVTWHTRRSIRSPPPPTPQLETFPR